MYVCMYVCMYNIYIHTHPHIHILIRQKNIYNKVQLNIYKKIVNQFVIGLECVCV